MTDAEIPRQRAALRAGTPIDVDSPEGGPPLLILAPRSLRPEAIVMLRQAVAEAWRGEGPGPRTLILEAGLEVFQLVGGEWRRLGDARTDP